MAQLAKKHQAAFFAAQGEVSKILQPYRHRMIHQVVDGTAVYETFAVYSRLADANEGEAHRWRGIVTVWYGMPIGKDERCPVSFSFDEQMFRKAAGLPPDQGRFEDTAALLATVIPDLPPE